MPAKKPAPKPAKAKKAGERGPSRARPAPASPQAAERAKAVVHARKAAPCRVPCPGAAPQAKAAPAARSRPQRPAAAAAAEAPRRPQGGRRRRRSHRVRRRRAAERAASPHAERRRRRERRARQPASRPAQRTAVHRQARRAVHEQGAARALPQILSTWKHDLMEEVDRTVSHMKDEAANFPDPNDRATQEEEFSLELRTRDRERKLIRKIDEALKRIDDGSYGYCLETGEEIGVKRLEARPVATLTIEAQERRERRERQYGDRDDRYR